MARAELKTVPWVTAQQPASLPSDGKRTDGRTLEEFRNVFFQPGVISQARGSVFAEHGSTKVMVAVYGPRASDKRSDFSETGRLQCDLKLATFSTPHRGQRPQTAEERDMSLLMLRALEPSVQCHKFPKAVVDVYATILESGGSDLAVCISAASIALAMAGVELYDLVAACRVGVLGGELLLDPTAAEESAEGGGVLLAHMAKRNEVTQIIMRGEWNNIKTNAALDLAIAGCQQLDVAMRASIQEAAAGAVS